MVNENNVDVSKLEAGDRLLLKDTSEIVIFTGRIDSGTTSIHVCSLHNANTFYIDPNRISLLEN